MKTHQVKALVRLRDNNVCTQCGMTAVAHKIAFGRDLEVHRLVPGSVYSLVGCVLLCRLCHKLKPKKKRGTRDLARKGIVCIISVPVELRNAMKALARQHNRKLTGECVTAFQAWISAQDSSERRE